MRYEPNDPRFNSGGKIKIVVIGGGTGLSNLLRGLKIYSSDISAVVTVADGGGSTGKLRKDFDMVAPGDIRKCIGALAINEELFSSLLEHRFPKNKRSLGGHTLGNIWITALTDYYGSFEKAIEVTSEIFQTAGRVLPATLDNVNLCIEYEDGKILKGEHYLDQIVKKIKKVYFDQHVRAYGEAVKTLADADLILLGPGSLYGSLIPNVIISGIRKAITENRNALKIYIANCSTERTQTPNYTIDDHLSEIRKHVKSKLFDICLVNSKVLKRSQDHMRLGEINNITTDKADIDGIRICRDDLIDDKNPLFHDSKKLARAIIELYNKNKKR